MSALGLLATDIQHDVMRTFVQRGPQYDLAGMEAVYQALHAEAAAHLAAEGLPPERQSFQRLADLRYARQGFEVTVDFPGRRSLRRQSPRCSRPFTGGTSSSIPMPLPIRLSKLSTCACALWGRWRNSPCPASPRRLSLARRRTPVQTRSVYFSGQGFCATPVYARSTLQATHVLPGPAIVEQLDATTVIFPGQEAVVDLYGNLLIHLLRS